MRRGRKFAPNICRPARRTGARRSARGIWPTLRRRLRIALLTPGRLGTEEDALDPSFAAAYRKASEEAALSMGSHGVCVSGRLPPSVHGEGDHGFVPALIGIA